MTKIGKNLLQSVYELSSSFPNSAASHKSSPLSVRIRFQMLFVATHTHTNSRKVNGYDL